MELIASAASVRQILAHFDEIGLDERSLQVGYVDPDLRRSRGPARVSARLSIDLLEAAAEALGRADFGLRHGLRLNLRGLDSISLLWDHASSVEQWYRLARQYVHLENNAVRYDLIDEGQDTALIHDILAVLRPRATQATFSFLTMTARVFREMLGPGWAPRRVEFMCARPPDITLFNTFFRCRIEFDAPRNALVVARSDFERPLPRHNPELVDFFKLQLQDQLNAWQVPLEDRVLQILLSELAGHPPTLTQIAGRLGLSPRTLQRRLALVGASFGELLFRARKEIVAAHMRRASPTPLSRLAFELGLSDATAASRFFRLKIRGG